MEGIITCITTYIGTKIKINGNGQHYYMHYYIRRPENENKWEWGVLQHAHICTQMKINRILSVSVNKCHPFPFIFISGRTIYSSYFSYFFHFSGSGIVNKCPRISIYFLFPGQRIYFFNYYHFFYFPKTARCSKTTIYFYWRVWGGA